MNNFIERITYTVSLTLSEMCGKHLITVHLLLLVMFLILFTVGIVSIDEEAGKVLLIYSIFFYSGINLFIFTLTYLSARRMVFSVTEYIDYNYMCGILVPYKSMPKFGTAEHGKFLKKLEKIKKTKRYKYINKIHNIMG